MRSGVLHGTSQRSKLDIRELHVLKALIFALLWIEFGIDTVENIARVVNDHYVLHANILVLEWRLAQGAGDLDEVLVTGEALQANTDSRHDRLFLLDDHARIGAHRPEVEVVLDTEREAQHERQQQQEPGSKTLYLG